MTQLSPFSLQTLTRELADHDDHQLLDIGLVRASDGSLRLADNPEQAAAPVAGATPFAGLANALRGLVQAVRAVPFHTSASGPVILTQQ